MANYPGILQDGSANNILPTPNSYANVIETSMIASQAYLKGSPVLFAIPGGLNGLHRAKAAIAGGDTFVLNTNVEAVNVGDLANQLWANAQAFFLDYQDNAYGYNTAASRGADTFHPFKSAITKTYIGAVSGAAASNVNVQSYGDYTKWTVNNFCYALSSPSFSGVAGSLINIPAEEAGRGYISASFSAPSLSYNASTGILSVSASSLYAASYTSPGSGGAHSTAYTTIYLYLLT